MVPPENRIELEAPLPILNQIKLFCETVSTLLHDNLIGLYLHGSLAAGGFQSGRSDVDLLVVVRSVITPQARRQLAQTCLAISKVPAPLELSLVTLAQLHCDDYPRQFCFHFSESWRDRLRLELTDGSWQAWPEGTADPDLAGQVEMTRRRGKCLVGRSIAETLPVIHHDHIRRSFVEDCQWALDLIAEIPVYAILNPCRTLAYLREGKFLTKAETIPWAMARLPVEIRETVAKAGQHYTGSGTALDFSGEELNGFALAIRRQLEEYS